MSPSEKRVEEAHRRLWRAVIAYRRAHVDIVTGGDADSCAAYEEWNSAAEELEAAVRADERARLQASDEASAMPVDPEETTR